MRLWEAWRAHFFRCRFSSSIFHCAYHDVSLFFSIALFWLEWALFVDDKSNRRKRSCWIPVIRRDLLFFTCAFCLSFGDICNWRAYVLCWFDIFFFHRKIKSYKNPVVWWRVNKTLAMIRVRNVRVDRNRRSYQAFCAPYLIPLAILATQRGMREHFFNIFRDHQMPENSSTATNCKHRTPLSVSLFWPGKAK